MVNAGSGATAAPAAARAEAIASPSPKIAGDADRESARVSVGPLDRREIRLIFEP